MRYRYLFLVGLALLIGFVIFQVVRPTYAAGTVGTGTPDSCTEAALDAALAGGGAITFNCGKNPVVIALTKEKAISQPTTLDGNGLVTLSGSNVTRVFHVTGPVSLELHKLKIAYGAANDTSDTARDGIGGGILNEGGTVTLVDSMIAAGRADHSGGGIYNQGGTLNLLRSTIAGNYVSDIGGGLLNQNGTVNLANTTLSGNFAGKNGGGLYNFAGSILITNSTIYDNHAGFNGSGILNNQEGKVAIKNSIIANAPASNVPIAGNCSGEITDGNKNLQFPGTSCGATIPVADPQLGTLSDNGGFVLTNALKNGSPAVDKADNTVCKSDPISALDGRVNPRPVGANCDIGAYEFDPKNPGKGFGENAVAACPPVAKPIVRTPTATQKACQPTQPGLPCNCNNWCDPGESYYTCPQDCPFAQINSGGGSSSCVQKGGGCSPNGPACCSGLRCSPVIGTAGGIYSCQ